MPPDDKKGKAKSGANKDGEFEGEREGFVIVERHGIFRTLVLNVERLRMVSTGGIQSTQTTNIDSGESIGKHYKQSFKMISKRETFAFSSFCISL